MIKTFEERKKTLLKLGKKKGYITFAELADELKGLDLDADTLDELYNVFNEQNIDVVEREVDSEGKVKEECEIDLLENLSLPKNISINDPVRMYLKEIGKISLLSFEEELELSKQVGEGSEHAKNLLAEANLR